MSTPNSASSGSESPKETIRINNFSCAILSHCKVEKFKNELEVYGEATPKEIRDNYDIAIKVYGFWCDETLFAHTPDPRIKLLREKMGVILNFLTKKLAEQKAKQASCITGACESLGLDRCCCIRKRSKVHSI